MLEGFGVGNDVGSTDNEGNGVGTAVIDGAKVIIGAWVGGMEGVAVGAMLGTIVGYGLGSAVGRCVGAGVGT